VVFSADDVPQQFLLFVVGVGEQVDNFLLLPIKADLLQHDGFADGSLIALDLDKLLFVAVIDGLSVNALNAKPKRKADGPIVFSQAAVEQVSVLLDWLFQGFGGTAFDPDVDVADLDVDVV